GRGRRTQVGTARKSASLPTRQSLILSGGYRLVAAIVVESALGLATEPAGLDVFHQQRAWPILRVRQPFMENLRDGQADIEADEVGKLERTHRVVRAELHGGVDGIDRAYPLIKRVDRLIDHRQQDAVDDEGREILRDCIFLAELGNESLGGFVGGV